MAQIDVIIPTLRPLEIERRIREFNANCKDTDYQLIVVGPFVVRGPRVLHVLETTPSGAISAMNLGFEVSTAPYVCYWSDDAAPTPNCLARMIDFLADRKTPTIGSFRYLDLYGQELPQHQVYNYHYACWGCASRETINFLGGLFNPALKSFWADPDLACRAWTKGGSVHLCPDSYILVFGKKDAVSNGNSKKYFNQDLKTFLESWHSSLGGNQPLRHWMEINKSLDPKQVLPTQQAMGVQTWHPRTFNKNIIAFVHRSEERENDVDYLVQLKSQGLSSYLLSSCPEMKISNSIPGLLVGQEMISKEHQDLKVENLTHHLNATWYLNLNYGEMPSPAFGCLSVADFIRLIDALGFNLINSVNANNEERFIAWKQPAANLFMRQKTLFHPAPDISPIPLILGNNDNAELKQIQTKITEQLLLQMMIMISCHQFNLGSKQLDPSAVSHFVDTLCWDINPLGGHDFEALSLALQSGSKENSQKYPECYQQAAGLLLKSYAKFSGNKVLGEMVNQAVSHTATQPNDFPVKLMKYF